MSNLRRYLDNGRLKRQPTSRSEIESLFKVVDRDLSDAAVTGISADRRFATAYNAALQLATIVLRAQGYRTSGTGHHWTTFAVLPDALGSASRSTADYLDACRARRNTVDYDGIGIATEHDVLELLDEAQGLRRMVETWLEETHPALFDEGPPWAP
jgi:hypothetical protein